MCGLVGMAGNLTTTTQKMFRDMLVFDQVRGMDSTGIAAIGCGPNESPVIEKEIGGPSNLFMLANSKLFNNRNHIGAIKKAIIGHNRAATLGEINKENAHPFEAGHIVGAHNGSLTEWRELENYVKNDVDSKSIIETIAAKGIGETWKLFRGAAALTWWDHKEGTINFARNDHRPLFYMWNKKQDVLFWASEVWMITLAAKRNNIDLFTDKEGSNLFWEVKTNTHYKFKVTATNCEEVGREELTPRPFPKAVTRTQNTGAMYSGSGGHNHQIMSSKKQLKASKKWNKGKSRASRNLKGTILCNPYMVWTTCEGDYVPYIQWEFKNSERGAGIRVFFEDEKDFTYWEYKLKHAPYKKNITATIKYRPRVWSVVGTDSAKTMYACAAQHIQVKGLESKSNLVDFPTNDEIEEVNKECFGYNGQKDKPKIYKDYLGSDIDRDEWDMLIRKAGGACAWCSTIPDPEYDHDTLVWRKRDEFVCGDCGAFHEKQFGYPVG